MSAWSIALRAIPGSFLAAACAAGCGGGSVPSASEAPSREITPANDAPPARSAEARAAPPVEAPAASTSAAPRPSASAAATAPRSAPKQISEVRIVDDARFWLVADGRAWQTQDGGATFVDRTPFAATPDDEWVEVWSLLASPTEVFVLRGAEELEPWMSLFVSSDGGATFTERRAPRLHAGREARLQRGPVDGSVLVLRTDGGGMNSHATSILETRDRGASFATLGTVTGYGRVTFSTPSTWWSVGGCCAGPASVYRSSNAGKTWSLAAGEKETWEPLSAVLFTDASHGARIVRASGKLAIERTTDGGASFRRGGAPAGATDVVDAAPDAWTLAGDGGGLLASTDGGTSWTKLPPLESGSSLQSVTRAPHGFIAVVAANGGAGARALLRLRDGAAKWDELSPAWR